MTEQTAPLAGGVVRGVDPLLHITPGLGEDFAHFPGHRPGDGLLAVGENISHSLEDLAADRSGGRGPGALRPPGRAYRPGDILLVRLGKSPDDVRGTGRVAILEILSGG